MRDLEIRDSCNGKGKTYDPSLAPHQMTAFGCIYRDADVAAA